MKRIIIISLALVLVVALIATPIMAAGGKFSACTRIQDGQLTYAAGHYLAGEPLRTGYDIFGYNYQARIFNGSYANTYLGGEGYPPYCGDDDDYHQRLIDEGYIIEGKAYGDVTLYDWGKGNFPEVWDLTKGDLTLSYTIDMSGVETAGWAVTEVGLREVGADNIDPNLQGGWMQSNYIDAGSDPDDMNLNDFHFLSKHGWLYQLYDAEDADTLRSPYWSGANYGFWFDRDGVDQWQDDLWGMIDGGTYNTEGVYEIIVSYHAIGDTTGTMFASINGVQQGLYIGGWKDAEPEFYPAGRSFTGDMTRMQVFYGRGGGGGSVELTDISVGYSYEDTPYGKWYWPYRDVQLQMKWNDAWLSNTDCDGDGKLDRHYGFDSYIGSGAWLTNHQKGEDEDGKWAWFVKIVAGPGDAYLDGGIWYTADDTEIGPVIWGQFAIIQEVLSGEGVVYLSPAGPGLGKW